MSRIALDCVSKRFRGRRGFWRPFAPRADVLALHEVTLAVAPGEAVALTGPNGCGKTTLLRIVAGVLTPTSGAVRVEGRLVYVTAGDRQFYDRLSGFENLRFLARLSGDDPKFLRAAFDTVGLSVAIDEPVWTYSTGMRVRLALARAVSSPAGILLLDEPTRSLDADGRGMVAGIVASHVARGATVLVATHDKALAASCDRTLPLATPAPMPVTAASDRPHRCRS